MKLRSTRTRMSQRTLLGRRHQELRNSGSASTVTVPTSAATAVTRVQSPPCANYSKRKTSPESLSSASSAYTFMTYFLF
ncbi:UNVERIFIED_CONTAM: hypothetical protein Sradi_2845800 [Sesamum radiatum]|uniref:Uncharacterized protein n=1 Tax=Sesamum radiatum TaxID=300843 RepID=A0AAW2RW39_SESRA